MIGCDVSVLDGGLLLVPGFRKTREGSAGMRCLKFPHKKEHASLGRGDPTEPLTFPRLVVKVAMPVLFSPKPNLCVSLQKGTRGMWGERGWERHPTLTTDSDSGLR